jgi:hypothetical protein
MGVKFPAQPRDTEQVCSEVESLTINATTKQAGQTEFVSEACQDTDIGTFLNSGIVTAESNL